MHFTIKHIWGETCPESREGQSTGALIPPKGPVYQTIWYKRLGKFISLEALMGIIDNMLERLSSRGRGDVEKQLPLNLGYTKNIILEDM